MSTHNIHSCGEIRKYQYFSIEKSVVRIMLYGHLSVTNLSVICTCIHIFISEQ